MKCPAFPTDKALLDWHINRSANIPAAINPQFLQTLLCNPEHLSKGAASLHDMRQVKGNFLENLKDNNVTKLSFTSKIPDNLMRTQWVSELLTRRQRVLDFRGGAGYTVGLVVWMFKRWHLLSKLPGETRKINKEKREKAYQNWKDADFAPYCGRPSCARHCPVSNRDSQHQAPRTSASHALPTVHLVYS